MGFLLAKISKFFRIIIISAFAKALFKHQVAAGIEHEKMLRSLRCKHVVDIGANRGQFALICRKVFPDARIDSFEPLDEPAARYRSVFRGDGLANLHPFAIGPTEGEAIIHISKADDSSSLLPITPRQSTLFPGTEEKGTCTIKVVPLDFQIQVLDIVKPALLKIDVQGYELEALKGCQQLLNQFSYVYVECSFIELYDGQAFAHDVIDFLHQRDFQLTGVYHTHYDRDGKAIQADFLFTNTISTQPVGGGCVDFRGSTPKIHTPKHP
jgi:FkbM family methyltransferase